MTFTLTRRSTAYRNEVGLFLVDDAVGRIGKLLPGATGYAEAAMRGAITLFRTDQEAGAVTRVGLPAGRYYAMYLVSNGSLARHMAVKPTNHPYRLPLVFFSMPVANPDWLSHATRLAADTVGFEDLPHGGDRDYDDAVVKVAYDSDPPAITGRLAHDTAPDGTTNADGVTFDPTITGRVTDASAIASLRAGFDDAPASKFIDVTADLGAGGAYRFSTSWLDQIHRGALGDGPHKLHLVATDGRATRRGSTSPSRWTGSPPGSSSRNRQRGSRRARTP